MKEDPKIFGYRFRGPTCPPSSPSGFARRAPPDAPNALAENRMSSPENSAHKWLPAASPPRVGRSCPRTLAGRLRGGLGGREVKLRADEADRRSAGNQQDRDDGED